MSAARKKIDNLTMQLFDPEVEKPEHDEIVKRLYADTEVLQRILTEYHGLKPLVPLEDSDIFDVVDYLDRGERKKVSLAEAVKMTGVRPVFLDTSPIRIGRRQMEVLMNLPTSERSTRLIGFIDIGVLYTIARRPRLVAAQPGHPSHWSRDEDRLVALIEVKSAWPTQGSLMRQLNLYAAANPGGFGELKQARFAVGPDTTTNEILCAHGYRLITFDSITGGFSLQADTRQAVDKRKVEQF